MQGHQGSKGTRGPAQLRGEAGKGESGVHEETVLGKDLGQRQQEVGSAAGCPTVRLVGRV